MKHRTTLNEIHSMFNRLGYNTQLLIEGKYSTKQGRHAISYMKQHGITDPTKQEQLLDSIMQAFGIQHTNDPRFNYILGLTRLALDGQLRDVNELKTSLNYIADGGHGNYDENLNGLSTDELIDRFREIAEEDEEKSRSEVAALGLGEQSTNGYEIVPITSEAQAEEYYRFHGGLGDDFWCITHGSYKTYGLDGTNQCYFCLKDGFENLMAPKDKSQAPFDEFGLSMISVIVDYKGTPTHITTRWNHGPNKDDVDGENNPELCTAAQVSQLIGVDFYSVFKPNEKGVELQRRLKECQQMLDSGMALEDVFDEVKELENGVLKVKLGNKYNLVVDRRVLCKQWFLKCYDFCEGLARVVRSDGRESYIRTDGKFIDGGDTTNLWFMDCDNFHNGFAKVANSDWYNTFLRSDGKFIDGGDTTNLWFNWCDNFVEGLAMVMNSEGEMTYLRSDGKFIDGGDTTNLWFMNCYGFRDGFAKVKNSEGECMYIDRDGNLYDAHMNPIQQVSETRLDRIIRNVLNEMKICR